MGLFKVRSSVIVACAAALRALPESATDKQVADCRARVAGCAVNLANGARLIEYVDKMLGARDFERAARLVEAHPGYKRWLSFLM